MAKIKKKANVKKEVKASPFVNYWTPKNYILLAASLGIIILGFILMGQGPWDNPISLHVSPLVLLLAYLIVIPATILFFKPGNKKEQE